MTRIMVVPVRKSLPHAITLYCAEGPTRSPREGKPNYAAENSDSEVLLCAGTGPDRPMGDAGPGGGIRMDSNRLEPAAEARFHERARGRVQPEPGRLAAQGCCRERSGRQGSWACAGLTLEPRHGLLFPVAMAGRAPAAGARSPHGSSPGPPRDGGRARGIEAGPPANHRVVPQRLVQAFRGVNSRAWPRPTEGRTAPEHLGAFPGCMHDRHGLLTSLTR